MMERLPRWWLVTIAEILADDAGHALDAGRSICPWWASQDLADGPSERDAIIGAACGAAVASLVAAPIRPSVGSEDDSLPHTNVEFAATVLVQTLAANGYGLELRDAYPLCEVAFTQLYGNFEDVDAVRRELIAALHGLDIAERAPVVFDPDPDEVGLPPRPVVYLASALTGFADVAPEWLWMRDVDGVPPGRLERPDLWDEDRRTRSRLGLEWQRSQNNRVARMLRAAGFRVYVPHEHFDPDENADQIPPAVDLGDRRAVGGADVLLLLGDFPATGAGKELVLAENGLQTTIVATSYGTRNSRLIVGTPHSLSEQCDAPEAWPIVASAAITAEITQHIRHARAREHNSEQAARLVEGWPDKVQQSEDCLLTAERAEQLRHNPELIPTASFFEVQELFRSYGFQMTISGSPSASPVAKSAVAFDPETFADRVLRRESQLRLDAPNSAEALRRAIGVRPAIEVASLGGVAAETTRDAEGQFVIKLVGSEPPRRQRFTLAHEVSHILVEGPELVVSHRSKSASDPQFEAAVDSVAAALLLPAQWMRSELDSLRADGVDVASLDALNRISNQVGLAPGVVARRLTDLSPTAPTVLLHVRLGGDEPRIVSLAGLPFEWHLGDPKLRLDTFGELSPANGAPAVIELGITIRGVRYRARASVTSRGNDAVMVLSQFTLDPS